MGRFLRTNVSIATNCDLYQVLQSAAPAAHVQACLNNCEVLAKRHAHEAYDSVKYAAAYVESMSKEAVQQSISALHAEIDQLDNTDGSKKEKLLALITDVEKQLAEPDNNTQKDANLQTLPTLIEQFEADHPKMTSALSGLLNTLSSMGV